MNLLNYVEDQLVANRLPLVGVSVAAVPHGHTPVVLTLHWHGFVEVRLADSPEAGAVGYQAVPSSALQINEPWDHVEALDMDVLEAAWQLGSWNLERKEAPGYQRPGAAIQEAIECHGAFGHIPVTLDGQNPVVAEVPDAEDLIESAGRTGYVQWLFRPVRGGLWAEVADDATLADGGYRNPGCPCMSVPTRRDRKRSVVYQLGRARSLCA